MFACDIDSMTSVRSNLDRNETLPLLGMDEDHAYYDFINYLKQGE